MDWGPTKEGKMALVKWRFWHPEGCIMGDFDEIEVKHANDGAEAAEILVQDYIDDNGTDSSKHFEIEISEPEAFVGIYDVAIEWDPRAVATKREVV
jgi:hypothetical protein